MAGGRWSVHMPLPVDPLAASESDIEAIWERIRDSSGLIEVDVRKSLFYANSAEPPTRFDAYGIDDRSQLDS